MKKLQFFTLVLSALACTKSIQAASFDCSKAGNKIERAICQDSEISKLDEDLSKVYRAVRAKDKGVVKEQRAWLKKRNKCSDSSCLKSVYTARISNLSVRSEVQQVATAAKLNPSELRRARAAGGCIAWGEQGNRILRRLGKSSNMNSLIANARQSVRSIRNQKAVNAEIQDWRKTVDKSLKETAKGNLQMEQVLAITFLKECAKTFAR